MSHCSTVYSLINGYQHLSQFSNRLILSICRCRAGVGGNCANGIGRPVGLGRPGSFGSVQRGRGHLRGFPQREMVPRIAACLRLQWTGQSGTVGRIVDQQVFPFSLFFAGTELVHILHYTSDALILMHIRSVKVPRNVGFILLLLSGTAALSKSITWMISSLEFLDDGIVSVYCTSVTI